MTTLENCRRSHIAISRIARDRQRNSGVFPYSDKSDSRRGQIVLRIFNVICTQSMRTLSVYFHRIVLDRCRRRCGRMRLRPANIELSFG